MISDDEQTINALRRAMHTEAHDHQLDPATATAVLDRLEAKTATPRRRAREHLAIAAVSAVVAGVAVSVYALRDLGGRSAHTATPPASSACNGAVVTSALPIWARAGFSPNAYVNPHVTGASGDIIGVLFADPLRAPQTPGMNNKILWVAKDHGTGPLHIRARLEGSSQQVTRTVTGGPGPSIIDMPAPGCWQLTLTWSGHTDTTALPYAP